MKIEIKKNWIEALRSGKYEQGFSFLYNVNSEGKKEFCCLGVLCDIQSDEIKKEFYIGNYFNIIYEKEFLFCGSYITSLSDDFLKFVELSFNNESQLIKMNDKLKYSFLQIADWIELNL